MDRYVYIRSNESDNYFSDNKACRFKVHLKTPLSFHGFWKVGLVELHAYIDEQKTRPKRTVDQTLYLFTNLCKESIVNGEEQPLLRRLEKNSKDGFRYIFDTVLYLPVKRRGF